MLLFEFTLGDFETDKSGVGDFAYWNGTSDGSCGIPVNAAKDMAVALSKELFSYNLCAVCVQITYEHRTIRVPVTDICASCDKEGFLLSEPAFVQFSHDIISRIHANYMFAKC
ncbi:hypothetical protein L596_023319 [Steinernema carpocapsae]|uniref:EF-1-gamma C-terminal domain-containing protein n=1 Tax=Steinernema carpocapsae TaxID=34508 RepID=A0A4U5MD93_STECR|nr:hypothetical protein L596_023319 [Steinernema carpocapsae]